VSSIIELGSSQRFVKQVNNVCLCAAFGFTLIIAEHSLPVGTHIALLGLAGLCAVLLNGPNFNRQKQHIVTHFVLHESEPAACIGIQKVGGVHQCTAILCEMKSVYTPFGCWLAFKEISDKKCSSQLMSAKVQWVFIPKCLLSSSQYKSICRHLIWHLA
jgi:hypothetical protein